jgi:putative transposase
MRVLERLIAERGRPENVRSDNVPDVTSRRMLGWAPDWKVGLIHIQPGRTDTSRASMAGAMSA